MIQDPLSLEASLQRLSSEQQNTRTRHIDQCTADQITRLIHDEDQRVAAAVEHCLPDIARAAEAVARAFRSGGRLLYFGAGTSGRLGILDASECPPTYGTPESQVVGIIAGGPHAIQHAVEGAEDNSELGSQDADAILAGPQDVIVGISASGRTPYVMGAMRRARERGATVVSLSNNSQSEMSQIADIAIEAVVGPEAILGSTRMKAGTAQKMVLNMLTTTAMILTGKVYDNLMVDMHSSNEKLIVRAKRLIQLATGADAAAVDTAYEQAGRHVKTAIVMLLSGASAEAAARSLQDNGGFVRQAISDLTADRE